MRLLFSLFLLVILSSSCKKQTSGAGNTVEFYLLESYSLVNGRCQVDAASAILEQTPLIANKDILAYSKSDYQYTISDAAFLKINALNPRTPFAITVDKTVVFYGMYVPGYISSTCEHSITMDPIWGGTVTKKLSLRLGYPGILPSTIIDDQRNNSRLIATLQKQGKLR